MTDSFINLACMCIFNFVLIFGFEFNDNQPKHWYYIRTSTICTDGCMDSNGTKPCQSMHYNFIQITVFAIVGLRLKNYPLQNRENLINIIENLPHSSDK